MTREQALEAIGTGGIIAIIRGDAGPVIGDLYGLLADAGVAAIEVTMNSPRVLDLIAELARLSGERTAVGVGTVTTVEEVRQAADAGARFIVSPETDEAVIETTRALGLASIPGCFTPTEIGRALRAGADAIKLFPAGVLGPAFLRAMRGPRPGLRTVPTGGVQLTGIAEWRAAGAWAFGIGSELVGRGPFTAERLPEIASRARSFVSACRRGTP